MRMPSFRSALVVAALSTFLAAQQPAAELGKWKQEANAAMQAKDYAAAAAWKKVTDADPKEGQAWQLLGYSLHVAGKLDEALPAHKKAAEFPRFKGIASYNIACVHALKGETDAAFQWLETCVGAGFGDLAQLQGDSDFDSLRKDPRYAKIEAAVKAKGAGGAAVQVFAQTVARKNTRAAWFSRSGSPGQIAIDWSPVPWQADYESKLGKAELQGKKWRLGADFWTRLDTTFDLHFGAVTVPAGYWYLTLEQRSADTFVLAFHDPVAVRKLKLDAFMANKLQGGIEVVLKHANGDVANELSLEVAMAGQSQNEGTVTIAFGPHVLAAPFTVKLE